MQKRKFVASIALAISVSIFTGCASLPSPEAMKAETADYQLPKLPEPDNAIVYVVRPSGVGTLVRFNVFVDNQEDATEVGYTRGSQYIYFQIPPGERKIYSKAENWAEMAFTAKAGDIVFVQQEPAMGFVMARNNVFKLEDYQGKYHVKNLSLGTLKSDK